MTPVTITFSKAVSFSSAMSVIRDIEALGVGAFDGVSGRTQFTFELPSVQEAFEVAQSVLTISASEQVPVAVNLGHLFDRNTQSV